MGREFLQRCQAGVFQVTLSFVFFSQFFSIFFCSLCGTYLHTAARAKFFHTMDLARRASF